MNQFSELKEISVNRTVINIKTILLCGLTGSGKTRFLNLIMGEDEESAMRTTPVSKKIKAYSGIKIEETSINMIDTVGLGDPTEDIDEITHEIMKSLFLNCPKLNQVLVFIKMDRLRAKISEDMNQLLNNFEACGMNQHHLHLVITFKDWFNQECCDAFYQSLLLTNIHPLLKSCDYSFISLANLNEVNGEFKQACVRHLQSDVNHMIKVITKDPIKPFGITSRIIEMQLASEKWFSKFYKWSYNQCCCCLSE